MWKEAIAFSGGILVATVAVGVGVYWYNSHKNEKMNKEEKENQLFADKIKKSEMAAKRYEELMATQSYVEVLTSSELSAWFKANKDMMGENIKMLIVTPTDEIMKGLGYIAGDRIDTESNLVQLFYNEKTGNVLKIRLINYAEIDSNLQANLIEQEGMMVVVE